MGGHSLKKEKQTWGAGAGVKRGLESEWEGIWGKEEVLKMIGKRKNEVRVKKRESSP